MLPYSVPQRLPEGREVEDHHDGREEPQAEEERDSHVEELGGDDDREAPPRPYEQRIEQLQEARPPRRGLKKQGEGEEGRGIEHLELRQREGPPYRVARPPLLARGLR